MDQRLGGFRVSGKKGTCPKCGRQVVLISIDQQFSYVEPVTWDFYQR
jgi:hypothetical protein